jgi:hypothetical protein
MTHGPGHVLPRLIALLVIATLLSACTELTVTPIRKPEDEAKTVGVRYYLPKPFIIFAPQADGTVSANVVFLPDKSHEYAINSSSELSSYAFQVSTDQFGLLTSVQYNSDTTAVAAQATASAGSAVAAGFNYQTAKAAAVQTQINTAQAGLISAQSAYASALAALNSDNQANAAAPGTVSASTIQVDASTVAQKQAALQVAQAALQAAQSAPQAVTGTAAAGTPVASAPAAAGTALTAPAWTQSTVISLPQQFGPVWFAVNDHGTTVSLDAVKSEYPQSPTTGDSAQPVFNTTLLALGPPQIPVPSTPFSIASKLPAVFLFNRSVVDVKADIATIDQKKTPRTQPVWDHDRTLSLDISKLKPGGYRFEVFFKYPIDPIKYAQNPKDAGATRASSQKFIFSVVAK